MRCSCRWLPALLLTLPSQQASQTRAAPAEIAGQVVDGQGRPCAGAVVELLRWPADTLPQELGYSLPGAPVTVAQQAAGEEGRFRFPVAEGLAYGLAARQGPAMAVPECGLLPGDVRVLTLAPARALAARVTEDAGEGRPLPVAGAQVTAWVDAEPMRRPLLQTARTPRHRHRVPLHATTGADGGFDLPVPGRPEAVTVVVRRSDGLEVERRLSATEPAELRLPAPGRLYRGRVVDKADGKPIADAWVHFLPEGPVARTGSDGAFLATGTGQFPVFGVVSPAHAPTAVPVAPHVATGAGKAAPVALVPGRRLAARLLRADGRPLAGAAFVCTHPWVSGFQDWRDTEWTTRTGADGGLHLGCLAKGELWVGFVDVDGIFVQVVGVVPDGDVALGEVRLDTGHRIEGRVLREDGTPMADATVFCNRDVESRRGERLVTPVPSRTVATDRRGRFVITGLLPVEYRLAVQSPDSLPEERAVLAERAPKAIECTLAPAPRLKGRVVDADGKPVAGATVAAMITPPGQPGPMRRPIGSLRAAEVLTDAGGEFQLAATVPGRGTLLARRKVGEQFQSGFVKIDTASAAEDPIEIRIQ